MNPETIFAIILLIVMIIAAVAILIIKGMSHDPDAWMDRTAAYWRNREKDDDQ